MHKWLTSPKLPKRPRRPHLQEKYMSCCLVSWCNSGGQWSVSWATMEREGGFPRLFSNKLRRKNWSPARRQTVQHIQSTRWNSKKGWLFPFTYTNYWSWKCVNSEVRVCQQSPINGVPSNGCMAPCRSHHGNHTRQEIDPSSDQLGTESLACKTKQDLDPKESSSK